MNAEAHQPRISFFLPATAEPVSDACDDWHSPLPLNRRAARVPGPRTQDAGLTNGDYFKAARFLLKRDRFQFVRGAVSARLKRPVFVEELEEIHIVLMKHGAFYHPALVRVMAADRLLCFVLNTAVSQDGIRILHQEVQALRRLHRYESDDGLPVVYGEVSVPTRCGTVTMFLADWFEGFHEFHLSGTNTETPFKISVWDETDGHHVLSDEQTCALYHRAARLLTAYYNPRTFEQIFPWHHAAGDFVVRVNKSDIDVRLITVRRYAPLFTAADPPLGGCPQPEQVMFGLLIFFLNLSIRMRIDRLDGTGDLVWAPDTALEPTWNGFLEGLGHGFFADRRSVALVSDFRAYLSRIPVEAAFDLAREAAGGFHAKADESPLIASHLIDHIAALWTIVMKKAYDA